MCPLFCASMAGRKARMSTMCEKRLTWRRFCDSALLVWFRSVPSLEMRGEEETHLEQRLAQRNSRVVNQHADGPVLVLDLLAHALKDRRVCNVALVEVHIRNGVQLCRERGDINRDDSSMF